MLSFKPLLSLALATFLLSGCSHLGLQEDMEGDESQAREEIVLYEQDGQQVDSEQLSTPLPEYNVGASSLSNSNVQVFSIDGAESAPALRPLERPYVSIPSSAGSHHAAGVAASNPSVEVFPLDDDMARAMGLSGMPAPDRNLGKVSVVPLAASPVMKPAVQGDFVALNVPGHRAIRIYFDHDLSNLDEGDIGAITTAAERHAQTPGSYLSVEGHASVRANIKDPVRRKIINLKVSMDRAFTVAKKLIEKGVPTQMIRAAGWGEAKPSAPVDGLDAESASRRVEISSASGQ